MEPRATLACIARKRMERKTDCATCMIYSVDVPFTFLICPDFNSRFKFTYIILKRRVSRTIKVNVIHVAKY